MSFFTKSVIFVLFVFGVTTVLTNIQTASTLDQRTLSVIRLKTYELLNPKEILTDIVSRANQSTSYVSRNQNHFLETRISLGEAIADVKKDIDDADSKWGLFDSLNGEKMIILEGFKNLVQEIEFSLDVLEMEFNNRLSGKNHPPGHILLNQFYDQKFALEFKRLNYLLINIFELQAPPAIHSNYAITHHYHFNALLKEMQIFKLKKDDKSAKARQTVVQMGQLLQQAQEQIDKAYLEKPIYFEEVIERFRDENHTQKIPYLKQMEKVLDETLLRQQREQDHFVSILEELKGQKIPVFRRVKAQLPKRTEAYFKEWEINRADYERLKYQVIMKDA